jgi:hypothetical protein
MLLLVGKDEVGFFKYILQNKVWDVKERCGFQHLHDVAAQFHHCFFHALVTTACVAKA